MERVFTVEEARTLLPPLRTLLERLQVAYAELADLAAHDGADKGAGNGSAAAASTLSAAEQRYVELARAVDALGVVVRDPATGLVDFAATRDDRPVYLCWRLGEPDIGHWHPRDTGIAGRQPL